MPEHNTQQPLASFDTEIETTVRDLEYRFVIEPPGLKMTLGRIILEEIRYD